MAKKRARAGETKGWSLKKEKELEAICSNIESVVKCKVECCICGDELEDEFETSTTDDGEKEFAELVHSEGWRESTSDKYGIEGIMCKTCLNTPDEERGDDDDENDGDEEE